MSKQILLVEDSEAVRLLVQEQLEHIGCQVTTAVNGYEAVQLAEDQDFAGIFMDVSMPMMDGLTAVRSIRQKGIRTPVVTLSANTHTTDRDRSLAAGCEEHIHKPTSLEVLEQTIKNHFDL